MTAIDPLDADGTVDRDAIETDDPDVAARLEALAEENRRLREEYARARRSRYRRTALGLAALGLLGLLGAALFPASRTVLVALGATGFFAGLLTYYLTPEQFLPSSVGESVYGALAANEAALTAELGLRDARIYVPTDAATPEVRLFVPQQEAQDLPDAADLSSVFVVTDAETERGVALRPTGLPLFEEFDRALAGSLASEPATLAEQLTDALVEQFELADSATPEADATDTSLTVVVTGSTYGAVDRFDHPITSFLAVGLAIGLDQPVHTETQAAMDDRYDYRITCTWDR